MQHQHDEIPFFKVWRNKYLRCYILNSIKSELIYDSDLFSNIESRQDYNSIISLEWMIKNNQYEMIIDKIKSGHYVHINNKSIKTLIINCNRYDIYELLFKYKRNDMERLDLIEESIKLNSVFALKSFIQLYGGVNSVANTIKNNGTGEYKSLMDIALSFASLDVANYLLLQPGLNWYTESMLLSNTLLLQKINYYDKKVKYSNQDKQSSGTNRNSIPLKPNISLKKGRLELIESFLLKKSNGSHGKVPTSTSTPTADQKSVISKYVIKNYIDQLNNKKNEINSKPINGGSIENVFEFIETKLNHSISDLSKKYKSYYIIEQYCFVKSCLYNIQRMDLLLNISYNHSEYNLYLPSNFQINFKDNINYIIYSMISYSSTSPNKHKLKSIIELIKLNKKQQKINNQNSNSQIKLLLDQCKTDGIIFKYFYDYYIDFHFYQSDFITIKMIFNSHVTNKMDHFWVLIFINFSIKGFQIYSELVTNTLNTIYSTLKLNPDTTNPVDKHYIEFTKSTFDQNFKCLQFNEIEQFINTIINENQYNYEIQWELIFQTLYHYYPVEYIELLISKFELFKNQFIIWINKTYYGSTLRYLKVIPFITNLSTGEIQFDKSDLFFKYNQDPTISKIILFNPSKQIENDITINQKFKLLQYLISKVIIKRQCKDIINIVNTLFPKGVESLDCSIEFYSSLNKNEIININSLNTEITLENCLFNSSIVNSIFNSNNECIKIFSLISIGSVGCIEELSRMKTDSINDKIEYIKFIYSNGLVSSFGCSLLVLFIKRLIKEIEIKHQEIIFKNYEIELVKLIQINSKSTISANSLNTIYSLSLSKRLNRLFNQIMVYCGIKEGGCIENEFISIEFDYIEIKNQLKKEFTNELIKPPLSFFSSFTEITHVTSLTTLFLNGNYKHLLNSFGNRNILLLIQDRNNFIFSPILKLSTKYHNLNTWIEVYNVISNTQLNRWENVNIPFNFIIGLVCKYGRIDILEYFFEFYKNDKQFDFKKLFQNVFSSGNYPIIEYLIKEKSQMFNNELINELFNISLYNGNVNIVNLIISTFSNAQFSFNLLNVLINGNINILELIINNNNLTPIDNNKSILSSLLSYIGIGNISNEKLIINTLQNHKNAHHFKNRVLNYVVHYWQ